MARRTTGFALAVAIGWIVLGIAGAYYARVKRIPLTLALPLIAAFLLEYVFYLAPGFERVRNWLADSIPPQRLSFYLALSALAPYLTYSIPTGQFRIDAAARLTVLVLAMAFWYNIRRPTPAADIAFLVLPSAVLLTKVFRQIYTSPVPQIEVLGHLMLIRLAAMVLLAIREVEGIGFGFLPTAAEWKIGLRYFLYFLPVGLLLAFALGLIRWDPSVSEAARAPMVFLGILWVVALSEELFRALLQTWITDWTGRPQLALILAAAIYGVAHLGFRHNWKWAIVTTALGWFCGKAFLRAGGIRAAMVTHAMVATVMQTLFS